MKYYLCLGSNHGNRKENLERAQIQMKQHGLKILLSSSLYETEPVGMPDETWFFNQVVEVDTDMTHADLLAWIKETEKKMGRDIAEKYKSRVIDMDILLAENNVIQTADIKIPHPKLAERNFVLEPLAEIASEVIHPILNQKIRDLLTKSEDPHQVNIITNPDREAS